MIVPTFARRAIVGYGWIVLAAVGTGFLSFGLWVHHMFTTGLPGISLGLFSAASQAVAIPTGLQIFCFIATVAAGRAVRSVPMLYAFGSLVIFVLGGLTGVMVALAPFDFQAHDTFFVVGHFHYVLIGGALFPILAGCYYFFPLIGGKTLSDRLGRVAFWLAFIGCNLAFLPMHLTGLRGMPRRVFTYPPGLGLETLNLVSTAGAFVLAAGLAVVFWDLVRPKGREPYARRNPWDAGTLEWTQEMPGRPWGIRSIPEIDSRYPLWDQPNLLRDVDAGRFYLPDAEEGKRETIITTAIDARPIQCLRLPGPTFITLGAAVTTGGFFIFGTYHWWWPALISLFLTAGAIVYWLWTGTAIIPEKAEKDVGLGVRLPLYASGPDSVGWWAMCITMLAVLTAFVSLVFGYFFFWTVRTDFPPRPTLGPGVFWPTRRLSRLTADLVQPEGARRDTVRRRHGDAGGTAHVPANARGGAVLRHSAVSVTPAADARTRNSTGWHEQCSRHRPSHNPEASDDPRQRCGHPESSWRAGGSDAGGYLAPPGLSTPLLQKAGAQFSRRSTGTRSLRALSTPGSAIRRRRPQLDGPCGNRLRSPGRAFARPGLGRTVSGP
jgi:cytochrome c oxidase subunit I+III